MFSDSITAAKAREQSNLWGKSGAQDPTVSEQLRETRVKRDEYHVPYSQADYFQRRNEMNRALLQKDPLVSKHMMGSRQFMEQYGGDGGEGRAEYEAPPMRRFYGEGHRPGSYKGEPFKASGGGASAKQRQEATRKTQAKLGVMGYLRHKLSQVPTKFWLIFFILLVLNSRRLYHVFNDIAQLSSSHSSGDDEGKTGTSAAVVVVGGGEDTAMLTAAVAAENAIGATAQQQQQESCSVVGSGEKRGGVASHTPSRSRVPGGETPASASRNPITDSDPDPAISLRDGEL